MITIRELNPHDYKTSLIIDKNLSILLQRINEIRNAYGKPMVVTSGLRSESDQDLLIAQKKTNAKHSKHLAGLACDIKDCDGELKAWIKQNVKALEVIGLWCEDFAYTPTWVHFQCSSPLSGKRFFIP